jgi:hypothetical protein
MGSPPGSATATDSPEHAVEPNVFLVDPLSQGIFTGLDLVGAFNFIPRWLPGLRSVRGCHRCRQDDESDNDGAQGGAPLHWTADIWMCAAVAHGNDSWFVEDLKLLDAWMKYRPPMQMKDGVYCTLC